jgi:hypothetical protein
MFLVQKTGRIEKEMKSKKIFTIYTLVLLLLLIYSCDKETFKWNLISKGEISNFTVISNTIQTTTLQANIVSDGNDENSIIGFCWSESDNPTILDQIVIIDNIKKGQISSSFNWSNTETKYYRVFVTNKLGTFYSNVIPLVWPGNGQNIPIVSTFSYSNIGFYNCMINAQIINDGGLDIIEKGILISTNSQPNFTNSLIKLNNESPNDYSLIFDSLDENTTYYVKAFAKNIAYLGFGNTLSFTTKNFYNIGEQGPSGGTVFYSKLDTIGSWNFLEVAPQDFPLMEVWSPNSNNVTTSDNLGDGLLNTFNIVTQYNNQIQYAAFIAQNYSINGFNDWYLPSRIELTKILENLFLNNFPTFTTNANYWSSSQDQFFTQNAWTVKMTFQSNNAISSMHKITQNKIRLIRRF